MRNTFHQIGSGPHAVMVLHGWFGDSLAFEPMAYALDGDAFTYLFMNYRGYGARRDVPGAYTIDEIAGDALVLADDLGLDRFSLIGHSMGGMAIERIAMQAPTRVNKMIAVAPVPSCGVAFDAAGHALFHGAADDVASRRTIIDRSTGGRLPSSWIDWKARYSVECSTREAFGAYLHAWSNTDFSAQAKGLPHPMLAIVGEHDPRFHAALMRETYLSWYPNAVMEVLPNAGHYPMNETPLALTASIERFLRA